MGRVQVQMAWQKNENTQTPWLRMTNPHAGSGKGMYFIPENGEEVLVAFENDNAEKPYIQGTMYNGNENSGFHTPKNDQKVIQTRSGNRIVMNDETGDITIESNIGQTIAVLFGDGNIKFKAPKNIAIEAGVDITISAGKNISISAGENISNAANDSITQSAGNDIKLTASGEIRETSDTRHEIAEKEIHRQTDKFNTISEKIDLFSEKENMTIQSAKTVQHNSAEKTKLF